MSFVRKFIWLSQRRRKEAEIQEELQFHLEEEAAEREQEGIAPEQAKWDAHREIGNVTLVQEHVRAVWIWTRFEQFVQDLRYALRVMWASKIFSTLAILSLALGIGANTAIYSFMDAIMLRSLPVSDPSSLVILQWHGPSRWQGGVRRPSVLHTMSGTTYDDDKLGVVAGIFPYPAFELFQKNDSLFSSIFAYHPAHELDVMAKGQAVIVMGEYVSGDYFSGLGVRPATGRMIVSGDDQVGSPLVAVVSLRFSERHYGGPANAAGQTILINNVPAMVVGVTPPEFFGVDPSTAPDVYLPMRSGVSIEAADPYGTKPKWYLDQNFYWIEIMARLRPGVSREQAQAALAPQFRQWVESTVTNEREREILPSLVVQEGAGGVEALRRRYSKPLYVLMALVGLILAIACSNIASLLLARATARRGEMALRLSLGAGRLRLVRQLLTESVLLASLGGILGVFIAVWGIRFLTVLLANGQTDFTLHANLNWHVLSVTAALALLTGILFGLAPALPLTRVDVVPALKKLRSTDARSRMRFSLSQALVVSQIALSLLMLVAAGLFVRTLKKLQSVEVGFNRENVLLFELDARKAGHKDPEISTFYGDLQKRFSTVPGVRNVSLSQASLITAGTGYKITVNGAPPDPATRILFIGYDFLKTMQIPILAGREIEERDQSGSTPVAVVSELFARVNFGDQNPLGQHLLLGTGLRDMEIVGVARNAQYGELKSNAPPVVYIPYNQGAPPPRQMVYELRTAGNPLALVNTVREIVHQTDARVPVTDIRTQVEDINQTINQEIVFAKLCTAFAVLALIIACVGLYGTVSYNVARRTSEIGIRMALGAPRGAVIWMVLSEVCVLAAVGLALSVPTAFATSQFLKSFLFRMKPNDPLAMVFAIGTLLISALVAGCLPARKASRIDPMIALRHE
ncbi:MAG: ABC transporter permease [Acidobacteriia bacterium]|nr:ABC transporter permease [Terriglobia bacterium]